MSGRGRTRQKEKWLEQRSQKKSAVSRLKRQRNAANRPKQLCQWTDEQMRRAMEAVMKGELGVNHSALEHGVPRTTLKDRLTGRVKHGANPRPVAYLNQKEEELVKLPFSQARAEMTTKEVFTTYFDLLKETLAKHDLLDKPAHIYNCDESGMPLQHKWPKTVAQRGTKKVRQRSSGDKTQISVLACGNGVGQAILLMVILAGSIMSSQIEKLDGPRIILQIHIF